MPASRRVLGQPAFEALDELCEQHQRAMLVDRRDLVAATEEIDRMAGGPGELAHGVERVVPIGDVLAEGVATSDAVAGDEPLGEALERRRGARSPRSVRE